MKKNVKAKKEEPKKAVKAVRKPVKKEIDYKEKYESLVALIEEEYAKAVENFSATTEMAVIKMAISK